LRHLFAAADIYRASDYAHRKELRPLRADHRLFDDDVNFVRVRYGVKNGKLRVKTTHDAACCRFDAPTNVISCPNVMQRHPRASFALIRDASRIEHRVRSSPGGTDSFVLALDHGALSFIIARIYEL
jgi:hypothetical protein